MLVQTSRWSAAAAVSLVCLQPARAAERVLLHNGFSIDCQRHAVVDGAQTRLWLGSDGASTMDVQTDTIAGVDVLPDAPRTLPQTHASPQTYASPQTHVDARAAESTPAELAGLIHAAGREHNINVALLQSVVNAESGGHVHAVSRAGAQGLMQLMPGTAKSLGVHDSFAPDENLRGGSMYLDRLLTRYHNDIVLALAAYNAGPGAVDRYHGVPPYRETVQYVSRIVREFNRRTLLERKEVAAKSAAAVGAGLP